MFILQVMQKHRMFLDTLLQMRNELISDSVRRREFHSQGLSGMDLLTAYKNYQLFESDLRGFWTGLKLAQGEDTSIETFVESIHQQIDKRNLTRSPPPGL